MKNGLLLINLGTPDHADTSSVRKYLCEFLADKRVITLPAPLRYLLLYGLILPFRAPKTAHAYQAIWTEEGSPLLNNSKKLLQKLQTKLNKQCVIALGMRYGKPSIEDALKQLQDCAHITILPLYPQYSSAATGSSIEKVLQLLAPQPIFPSLEIIRDFHQHPQFINAEANLIKSHIVSHDFILFSYHGLPEHHLKQAGCQSICHDACPSAKLRDHGCYRAQCMQTTSLLATALGLKVEQYGTSFQSRLGKTPWIKPYTDEMLIELANRGIKRLAIACPSFVADCLETLEEMGIRAREQWTKLGGEQFTLIPCLNDHDDWVDAIITIGTCTK